MDRKGQVSIEVIIIVIFLIIFVTVFNDLSKDTVKTIEVYKIKEQQSQIADSVSGFLKTQEILSTGIADDNFNISFENSLKIPNIMVPSTNVDCRLVINPGHLNIIVNYDQTTLYYDRNLSLNMSKYKFTDFNKYCGDYIICNGPSASGEIICQ